MAETIQPLDSSPAVPDMPPRMIMDLRTDCNLKCPMCLVHGDPDNPKLASFLKRDVDLNKAIAVLEEVAAYKPLWMPSLWSEPLLAKNFQAFAAKVKELGMTLALNTNGLTLREPLADFFVEVGVDAVCFSIDATTPETLRKIRGIDKLDKLHHAVRMMLDARGSRPHPRIGVSFTTQDGNAEEEQAFIDHWTKIVDFVRTGALFSGGAFATVQPGAERRACAALYNTMAIHADGNVSYCCLDGFAETSVGNVFEDGVRGVWHGEKMTGVRRWHETGQWDKVPFCINCDRWASYDFEEQQRDGLLIRRSPEYTYYNRIDRLGNWTENMTGGLHDIPDPAALSTEPGL